MQYKGITISCPSAMPPAEAEQYAEAQLQRWPDKEISAVNIKPDPDDPDFVIVTATERRPIERIRRITGYLTGSVDRWNNAKQAELKDRTTHG